MCKTRTIFHLIFSIIYMAHGEIKPTKKLVCVIGVGPSGLVAVKQLSDDPQNFVPIAFEKNSDVGGLWIYTNSTTVDEHGLPLHSSMYKNMRTNTAKEFMSCPDYQEFHGEERSSVLHQTVVDYLKNYTRHFKLRKYIQFDTLVEKVSPLSNVEIQQSPKWLVQFRNLNTNESGNITCDDTIVANGQYHKPSVPKIPGMETFSGRVIHSHTYRHPEDFTDQRVVVLGAGDSGLGIAFDLSKYVETIYLSHRHDKITKEMPNNVIQVAGVVAAHGNRLILQDGTHITADSLIYCTGYKIDLPFLDASSGIDIHDKYLYPTYRGIINVQYPSMAILGYNWEDIPFCLKFCTQAKYYIAYLEGKLKLPNRQEMLEEATLIASKSKKMSWADVNQIVHEGQFEPIPEFYERAGKAWRSFFEDNMLHAKDYKMIILNDGTIKIVKLETDRS